MGARGSFRGLFNPANVSAVSAWLRFAQGTITGSGFSSVPDVLASNPATQSTDALRPPLNNTANGLQRGDFAASDFLSWPAASNNNQTAASGFATWVEFDALPVSVQCLFGSLVGATNRIELCAFSNNLFVNVFHSQFVARRGTASAALTAGTKLFVTWEYDASGANDAAKCVLTLNASPLTLAFTDDSGAPGAMPSALVATAGPHAIGARRVSDGLSPVDGKMGPNIFILGSKMAGATTGLLTTEARTNLMNFEAPT
jgi:peptidoglycan hydrolase-like protein with peptidoglycan-binding domain